MPTKYTPAPLQPRLACQARCVRSLRRLAAGAAAKPDGTGSCRRRCVYPGISRGFRSLQRSVNIEGFRHLQSKTRTPQSSQVQRSQEDRCPGSPSDLTRKRKPSAEALSESACAGLKAKVLHSIATSVCLMAAGALSADPQQSPTAKLDGLLPKAMVQDLLLQEHARQA